MLPERSSSTFAFLHGWRGVHGRGMAGMAAADGRAGV